MMSNFEGMNDSNKPTSKVLRPPGGGSSDIFGTDLPQTPRVVKNHMQSNIFSTEKDANVKNTIRQGAHRFYFIGDQPRRAQKNLDSYQRLFGEPERPFTPAKNHMKSNIPFGAKTEAAQQLLTNGSNGHAHHNHSTSGKTGSVSSASSSVSSSTENLKINGFSKAEKNEYCAKTPTPEESPAESIKNEPLPQDEPCVNKYNKEALELQSKIGSPRGDAESQTRTDTGSNPENPYSASKPVTPRGGDGADGACIEDKVKLAESRNPITGLGLNGDGVGGWKPKKTRQREGNPVTGEGYNGPVNVPGVHPVINKNRVPPGGFSSGLW